MVGGKIGTTTLKSLPLCNMCYLLQKLVVALLGACPRETFAHTVALFLTEKNTKTNIHQQENR